MISGGGTGGHVFPAIAIANALKAIEPNAEIRFIGALGRLEMQKVPEAGYEIDGLWISGVQRDNFLKNILLPIKVISSLMKANKIINRFNPDVMVGVGGYASGPAMYMAARKNIPVLIQEQNSFAGVTNKLMAKQADRFCVAYDGMDKFFPEEKIIKTGNPVRQAIAESKISKKEGLDYYNLSEHRKTILVIGGSLGARTINESIKGGLQLLIDNHVQLIWQTGKFYYQGIKDSTPQSDLIRVMDFIVDMNMAYAAADVIISRAGALAISELCIVGKPVILVPSPNVAEDHQTKNALALVEKNAALMVKDNEAKQNLVNTLIDLLQQHDLQQQVSTNITTLGIPNAAELIAKEVLQLAG